MAMVVTVDGKGIAKLRRKAGTETTVAAFQQLQAGDKITTDDKAVVQLSLPDGTLVRIGINSEYRIESARAEGSFTAWVFSLARGSIRALVEKSVPRKEAKFRVNTPAGTMGVRGTELVLEHNAKTNVTTLYTIEGKVSFGALDCEERNTCIEVKAGEVSSIGKGAQKPEDVKGVNLEEMTKATSMELKAAVGDKGEAALSSAEAAAAAARLSVLAPLAELGKDPTLLDDTALMKAAKEASQELADLQDVLANRDKPTRAAMEQAARDGTLDDRLALGKAVTNDGSEKEPLNKANAVTRFKAAAKYESEKANEGKDGGAKGKENAAANQILSKIKAQEAKSTAKANSILKKKEAQVKRSGIDLVATIKAAQSKLAETVKARNAALAAGKQDHASKLADEANELVKEIKAREEQQQKEYDDMKKGELVESDSSPGTPGASGGGTGSAGAAGQAKQDLPKQAEKGCGPMAEDAVCKTPISCDTSFEKCGHQRTAWTAWCKECNKDKSLYFARQAEATPENRRAGGIVGAIVGAVVDAIQDSRASNSAAGRKCYDTKRVCETKMIPCSLLSGKKCTPKYEQKCQDKQIETQCR